MTRIVENADVDSLKDKGLYVINARDITINSIIVYNGCNLNHSNDKVAKEIIRQNLINDNDERNLFDFEIGFTLIDDNALSDDLDDLIVVQYDSKEQAFYEVTKHIKISCLSNKSDVFQGMFNSSNSIESFEKEYERAYENPLVFDLEDKNAIFEHDDRMKKICQNEFVSAQLKEIITTTRKTYDEKKKRIVEIEQIVADFFNMMDDGETLADSENAIKVYRSY